MTILANLKHKLQVTTHKGITFEVAPYDLISGFIGTSSIPIIGFLKSGDTLSICPDHDNCGLCPVASMNNGTDLMCGGFMKTEAEKFVIKLITEKHKSKLIC